MSCAQDPAALLRVVVPPEVAQGQRGRHVDAVGPLQLRQGLRQVWLGLQGIGQAQGLRVTGNLDVPHSFLHLLNKAAAGPVPGVTPG